MQYEIAPWIKWRTKIERTSTNQVGAHLIFYFVGLSYNWPVNRTKVVKIAGVVHFFVQLNKKWNPTELFIASEK